MFRVPRIGPIWNTGSAICAAESGDVCGVPVMSDVRYRHFTQQQVEHLRAIINVLLPFQSLLPGAVNYAEKLAIVEFIDGLLAETARDEDLIARFARVAVDPLAQCPIADA